MKQPVMKSMEQQYNIMELVQMFFAFFGGALGLFIISLFVEMIA